MFLPQNLVILLGISNFLEFFLHHRVSSIEPQQTPRNSRFHPLTTPKRFFQTLRKWMFFEAPEVPQSLSKRHIVAMGAGGSVKSCRSGVTPVVPVSAPSRRKLPVSFTPVVPLNTKKLNSKIGRFEKLKLMKKANDLLIAETEQETWISFVTDFSRIRFYGVKLTIKLTNHHLGKCFFSTFFQASWPVANRLQGKSSSWVPCSHLGNSGRCTCRS